MQQASFGLFWQQLNELKKGFKGMSMPVEMFFVLLVFGLYLHTYFVVIRRNYTLIEFKKNFIYSMNIQKNPQSDSDLEITINST